MTFTELLALCEQATPGPWKRVGVATILSEPRQYALGDADKPDDAAFIADANPQTVAALIRVAVAAKEHRDARHGAPLEASAEEVKDAQRRRAAAAHELDAALAALAEVMEDGRENRYE